MYYRSYKIYETLEGNIKDIIVDTKYDASTTYKISYIHLFGHYQLHSLFEMYNPLTFIKYNIQPNRKKKME